MRVNERACVIVKGVVVIRGNARHESFDWSWVCVIVSMCS